MLGKGDAEVIQVLVAVDRGILNESLSQVERALELTVVCIVILVSYSDQIKIAAALVCVRGVLLSQPKSS